MSEQQPPTMQQRPTVQLLRLGMSDYGILQAGLNVRIIGGQVIVSVALGGGKVSPIRGLLPLEVELVEVTRKPITEVIELFEAKEALATGNANGLLVVK